MWGGSRRTRQEESDEGGSPDGDRGGDRNREGEGCDSDQEDDGVTVTVSIYKRCKNSGVFLSDDGDDSSESPLLPQSGVGEAAIELDGDGKAENPITRDSGGALVGATPVHPPKGESTLHPVRIGYGNTIVRRRLRQHTKCGYKQMKSRDSGARLARKLDEM